MIKKIENNNSIKEKINNKSYPVFDKEILDYFNSNKKEIIKYILFDNCIQLLAIDNNKNKTWYFIKKEIVISYLNKLNFILTQKDNISLDGIITIQKKAATVIKNIFKNQYQTSF